jgi:hypothetical protein
MANPGTNEIRRVRALKKANALKAAQEPKKKVVVKPVVPKEVVVPATPEVVDYSSMTKSQMQELLTERGITYLPQSTKRILLGLLENA